MGEGVRGDFRKGQWQRELQDCLAREVANWQAKPARQILLELDDTSCGYSGGYEVLFLGAAYHVCVRLLDADAQVITIDIDVQPDDEERIRAIATPREPGSSGWSNAEMAVASEIIFVRR